LSSAVSSFNASVGTLEARVLVSARQLAELSVVDPRADGDLPAPEQILGTTRTVAYDAEVGRVR
jgi:DNA recombination protein RmuC